MFEVTREEKELVLNSADYFADIFFACQGGKVFVKVLAEVIQAIAPDADIFWDDSFYFNKEEFKEIVEKILREVSREKHIPFDVTADPFYSESNMAHLRRGAAALNAGKGVEHEPVDVEGE